MEIADSTVVHEGVCLAVRDFGGEGPPMVLIHGATHNLASWHLLVPRLVGRHRVVAFDLRGHGESDEAGDVSLDALADDTHAICADLDLEGPIIAGHSLGGAVAVRHAERHPTRAVVGIDGGYHFAEGGAKPYDEETIRKIEEELVADPIYGFRGDVQGVEELLRSDARAKPRQVWEPLLRRMCQPDEFGVLHFRPTPRVHVRYIAEGTPPFPSGLPCPTLFLVATRARNDEEQRLVAWKRRLVADVLSRFSCVRSRELEVGHYIPQEAAEGLAEILTEFARAVA